MTEPVEQRFASGCTLISGGVIVDNEEDAGGASGGLSRGTALSSGGMWMGLSELPSGHASMPHHHEDQTTIVCIIRGSMDFTVRLPDGSEETFTANKGDIAAIPGGLVHREFNPSSEPCVCVVVRNAESPVVVNLEEPATAP
jgi:uncharacterized RmlC-like cupin family protein